MGMKSEPNARHTRVDLERRTALAATERNDELQRRWRAGRQLALPSSRRTLGCRLSQVACLQGWRRIVTAARETEFVWRVCIRGLSSDEVKYSSR